QHGVIMGEEAFLPVFATKQAVYGRYEAAWYAARGVRPECLEVTGHPRYDAIATDCPQSEGTFAEQAALRADTAKLLIVTHPLTDKPDVLEAVKQLAAIPQVEIIIKPHPWKIKKGYDAAYAELAELLPNVKLFPQAMQLYDVLPHVDLVMM